jgi:outer membrane murein-binding lipoprotein Lpp
MNTKILVRTLRNKSAIGLRTIGLGAVMLGATALSSPVWAQTASANNAATIDALSSQLHSLQAQIDALRAQEAQTQVQVKAQATMTTNAVPAAPATEVASNAPASGGTAGMSKQLGGVKITPGGFIEAAEIYRSRNEVTGIGSNFNTGIPLPNSTNYRTSEFRASGQQSRLSLLAQGQLDNGVKLAGYYETDFISAAPTANSNESNSYNLRMRLANFTADLPEAGLHFAAGQTWSLATMTKTGLLTRSENPTQQIDAQYMVGYNWARQLTLRAVQDVTPWAQVGVSVEEPQAVFTGGVPSGTVVNNAGTSQLDPSATYSTDVAPDVIAKIAIDPGFGHYEAYGLARWFHDQTGLTKGVTGNGDSNTVAAGGVGFGAIVPVIPKLIDFQVSGLIGHGIGRYGSAGLPDATVNIAGSPKPIKEDELLVGLVAHPTSTLDIYGYGGLEQEARTAGYGSTTSTSSGVTTTTYYGYGNPAINNSGCDAIGGSCGAQTSSVRELTAGFWYTFYKGRFGKAEFGAQDAEFHRDTFAAVGGAPRTNMNVLMTSFRYYPF